jgi:hypothetical protein
MTLIQDLTRLISAKPIGRQDRDAAALFTLDLVATALVGRYSKSWLCGDPGRAGRRTIARWPCVASAKDSNARTARID